MDNFMNLTKFVNADLPISHNQSTDSDEPDDSDAVQLLVSGFMLTAFSLIGIVGNAVSLTVLSRPSMRSSVNCVLQALAAFDLGVLASAILMLGLRSLSKSISYFSFYSWYLYPRILPVVYPLGLIFQTGSIWSTVAVTVERYVAVCHPLRARSLCTHRNAKFYNSLVVIFSVAYNLPRFFEVHQEWVCDPATNETALTIKPSEFRVNKLYIEIYYIWLYLFFIYFVPFVILAFLNVKIWKSVRKANHSRRTMSNQQRREISMAVMLLSVVAVFLVCNALGLVVNILEYCNVAAIAVLVPFSNFLVVVNSSINFVIYCIFGKRFKRLFTDTLLCRSCCADSRKNGARSGPSGRGSDTLNDSTLSVVVRVGDATCSKSYNGTSVFVKRSGNDSPKTKTTQLF